MTSETAQYVEFANVIGFKKRKPSTFLNLNRYILNDYKINDDSIKCFILKCIVLY